MSQDVRIDLEGICLVFAAAYAQFATSALSLGLSLGIEEPGCIGIFLPSRTS